MSFLASGHIVHNTKHGQVVLIRSNCCVIRAVTEWSGHIKEHLIAAGYRNAKKTAIIWILPCESLNKALAGAMGNMACASQLAQRGRD